MLHARTRRQGRAPDPALTPTGRAPVKLFPSRSGCGRRAGQPRATRTSGCGRLRPGLHSSPEAGRGWAGIGADLQGPDAAALPGSDAAPGHARGGCPLAHAGRRRPKTGLKGKFKATGLDRAGVANAHARDFKLMDSNLCLRQSPRQ